jgi:hypothetical protein
MKNRTGGIYEADAWRATSFAGLFEFGQEIRFFSPVVIRECANSAGRVDRSIIGRGKIGTLNPVW